ncbi:PREDICTED: uncharacterized protein LOC106120591 [Papilio xuthus]|uniref:Uncharacterized protein LOC106120591 n=1 Tax=Papilio xuthus TaxID=66420 RepID=A0AAJ6ZFG0_PAPXU|nr:PREDICTED: uncharacterized protein LOC106120591 [Papilio xuthus]
MVERAAERSARAAGGPRAPTPAPLLQPQDCSAPAHCCQVCYIIKSPEQCECEREPLSAARDLLAGHERRHPHLFSSLKTALLPLIAARNVDRESAERRHRKKSVIQMRNGAPVVDSDDGSEEEPVP